MTTSCPIRGPLFSDALILSLSNKYHSDYGLRMALEVWSVLLQSHTNAECHYSIMSTGGPVGLWLSQEAGDGDDLSHEVREVITDCGFPTGACSLSPLVSSICQNMRGKTDTKEFGGNLILFQLLRKGFLEAENHPDDGAREAREP